MTVIDKLLEFVVRGLGALVHGLQRMPRSLLAIAAWGFLGLVAWWIWSGTRETLKRSRRMHQIPCADCQFFTHDHRLKCTVHPNKALTEEAIGCLDFEKKEG